VKDSVLLDGKIYISSRRAAEISHYTTDYVGQLCRSGKVDCRIVGRAWFVTEESVLAHQKLMANFLTNGFNQATNSGQKNVSIPSIPPVPTTAVIQSHAAAKIQSHFFKTVSATVFAVMSLAVLASVVRQSDPQLADAVTSGIGVPVSQVMGRFVTPAIEPITSTISSAINKTPIAADYSVGYASVSDAFAYGWNGMIDGISSGILNILNLGTILGGQTSPIQSPIQIASTGSTSTIIFDRTTAGVPVVTNKVTNNVKTFYVNVFAKSDQRREKFLEYSN